MLQKTPYTVDVNLLQVCAKYAQDGKLSLNYPTGDFFYDSWKILPEYQNTAIETVLNALPFPVGEARLVKLKSGTCYFAHADIDDRFHLNLTGTFCTLHDFQNNISYPLKQDGVWYEMDAGVIHTAVNAGEYPRIQLLVRKLLPLTTLKNPVKFSLTVSGENARYRFDNTISPWLNSAVKRGLIDKFKVDGINVSFDIEKLYVNECVKHIPEQFQYEH